MPFKISKRLFIGFFFCFSILFFLIFSGCVRQETPKKVSLLKRAVESSSDVNDIEKNTLKFGFDLRLDPKEDVRIYSPFLEYLQNATGKRFSIKFTEKYEDTVDNLGKGITHFAAIGPLSYAAGREKYGNAIKYLVSGVNNEGDPRYQAVIFTRPEAGIRSIEDLRGKPFAFGPRMSTQGHLIPRKMLEDKGITIRDLSSYIHTDSHMSTVRVVLNGEYEAGGIQDVLAMRLEKEGKIRILKISEPYPSSIIAYNSAVDSETVKAVRSALLVLEPEGKHKDKLIDWDQTEMQLGFVSINESEFYKVAVLARRYGLLPR